MDKNQLKKVLKPLIKECIKEVLLEKEADRGRLNAVLPEVQCPKGVVYMVWADRKLVSARVAAFRDLITERMSQPWKFLSFVSRPNAR